MVTFKNYLIDATLGIVAIFNKAISVYLASYLSLANITKALQVFILAVTLFTVILRARKEYRNRNEAK